MKKKKKSKQLIEFIEGLHKHIIDSPQFRRDTRTKSETDIQRELRSLIIQYLAIEYKKKGKKDCTQKANESFYWEGQEGKYGNQKRMLFASRNYPDFIIKKPYLVAIEYKKSASGSDVKRAIGQALMHTLSDEFDFVYVLFHDEDKDGKISGFQYKLEDSMESKIIKRIWDDFNVFMRFTSFKK